MQFKDGFECSAESEERLERFYNLVTEYNKKVNLTAITEREEFFTKHVWDSVAGQAFFKAGARAVEVGSGGGFPSIPLKIVRPDINFTLIESVGKKCAFLKQAVEELELDDTEVLCMRAEDAGRMPNLREKFDICCARAVARMNTLLEYCTPLIRVGGRFVAYKADAAEEIEEAERAAALLGCRLVTCERYELPDDMGERTLAVYEKVKHTPAAYPRGNGKERKRPL